MIQMESAAFLGRAPENAMNNFFGNIEDAGIQGVHLTGTGWIGAFFILGAIIIGGRLLMNWNLKRLDKAITLLKEHDDADQTTGGRKAE
jgi:hypothetical protein